MARGSGKRDQKKREKQKKKRAAASKKRAARAPVGPPTVSRAPSKNLSIGAGWPVGDCYLSENWHEHGVRIVAAFVRENADGRAAVAVFEADLRQGGVQSVQAVADVHVDSVVSEMAQRSQASGVAMRVVEPELVVKCVQTALAFGDQNGVARPSGLDAALTFFGEVDGDVSYEILTGEPPPPKPKKRSLFTVLFGS